MPFTSREELKHYQRLRKRVKDARTPEEGAASREMALRLQAAIAGLPPKQRAALTLSRFDGLAYQDVANALGCTEGAVKALVFRATQTLKRDLREYL